MSQVRTVKDLKAELAKYPDATRLVGYNGGNGDDTPISVYPITYNIVGEGEKSESCLIIEVDY